MCFQLQRDFLCMRNASNPKCGFGNQKIEQNELGGSQEVNSVYLCLQVFGSACKYQVVQCHAKRGCWRRLGQLETFYYLYLLFPSSGNSLKKCSLIFEVSSPCFWSPKCRHGLHACVCLLFTLHSSVFLQTTINIQGHAQSPEAFSRWCESANSLCYLAGKYIAGMSPPPLGSPSTENMVRETSASERAIITVGSPGKCDGDTSACMCCMWRSADAEVALSTFDKLPAARGGRWHFPLVQVRAAWDHCSL